MASDEEEEEEEEKKEKRGEGEDEGDTPSTAPNDKQVATAGDKKETATTSRGARMARKQEQLTARAKEKKELLHLNNNEGTVPPNQQQVDNDGVAPSAAASRGGATIDDFRNSRAERMARKREELVASGRTKQQEKQQQPQARVSPQGEALREDAETDNCDVQPGDGMVVANITTSVSTNRVSRTAHKKQQIATRAHGRQQRSNAAPVVPTVALEENHDNMAIGAVSSSGPTKSTSKSMDRDNSGMEATDASEAMNSNLGSDDDQPGAYCAQGRAFGDYPEWARRLRQSLTRASLTTYSVPEQEEAVASISSSRNLVSANMVSDAEAIVYASNVTEDHSKRNYRIAIGIGVFALAAIIGLIVGLVVARNNDNNGSNAATGNPACLLSPQEQTVFEHCTCNNGTARGLVLSDEEWAFYDSLTSTFVSEGLLVESYDRASCERQNQALLWTANYERFNLTAADMQVARRSGGVLVFVQRFVLVSMYLALDGDGWIRKDGWLTSPLPCFWFGIRYSILGGISEINLISNGLNGELPDEFLAMPFLNDLNLAGNQNITGVLPFALDLQNTEVARVLHNVDLGGCSMSGRISSEIYLLSHLSELNLDHNALTGSCELGLLDELNTLHLVAKPEAGLSGTLPSELGLLTNLRYMSLKGNKFNGPLPTELGNLNRLAHIDIRNTDVNGTIPDFLGSLSMLDTILLSNSQVTGPIPETFCTRPGSLKYVLLIVNCEGPYVVDTTTCSCCNDEDFRVLCVEELPSDLLSSDNSLY